MGKKAYSSPSVKFLTMGKADVLLSSPNRDYDLTGIENGQYVEDFYS